MGTLTADMPRLDEYCPHKLPTSCRLTSTPLCCACADERQHTATYRVYIDGIGFVHRGTRWQSYCWFCKGRAPLYTRLVLDSRVKEWFGSFDYAQSYLLLGVRLNITLQNMMIYEFQRPIMLPPSPDSRTRALVLPPPPICA
jgi:hypothetical protein